MEKRAKGKLQQAIIVDQQLTWRFAASYLLESAYYNVTPIKADQLQNCLTKNGDIIDLALIQIDEHSQASQLIELIQQCQQKQVATIFAIDAIQLSALYKLYELRPNGLILTRRIEQLSVAIQKLSQQQRFCANNLTRLVTEYQHFLLSTPSPLHAAIKSGIYFDGKRLHFCGKHQDMEQLEINRLLQHSNQQLLHPKKQPTLH